jgi:starch phosphorylase
VRAGTCFTTHTPVPAGNDAFSPQLIEHYLGWYSKALKLDRNALLGLGRIDPNDTSEPFGMTVLAIRLANTTNGVSKLHGQVSRELWQHVFPQLTVSEVPITSITNGVHARSWISGEMTQLYQRYLGVEWDERPADHSIWKHAEQIPDAELWRTHERRRERLVVLARRRLKEQLQAINAPNSQVDQADEVLDPDALTIGFARRFATYKRGDLVFRDIERLIKIVNATDRPVQFIFAGKAHPPPTPTAKRSSSASCNSHGAPSSAGASSSSRTTTSPSRVRWCKASTSGSTRRAVRSKPRAPAE